MLKIYLHYDLPAYDPKKHDPDKVFGFLTYRGVHYAKWINLKSKGSHSWKLKQERLIPLLFLCYNIVKSKSIMEKERLKLIVRNLELLVDSLKAEVYSDVDAYQSKQENFDDPPEYYASYDEVFEDDDG